MDDVAAAIADPVRRQILEVLRDGPVPAGQIAAAFPISRPAISRHLRVLRESGLVSDTVVGRERHYELQTQPLGELREWIDDLTTDRQAVWERRFDALETEVYRARRDRRKTQEESESA